MRISNLEDRAEDIIQNAAQREREIQNIRHQEK